MNTKLVKIGNKKYQISSDDNYLTHHVRDEFEPQMVKIFKSLIRSDDYVFDVGANIGCTSILFGEIARKVFSFEPAPSTFAILEKNIENSELQNIELLNIGLGSKSYDTTITYSPYDRSGGFVSDQTHIKAGHITEDIVIKTIDEIFSTLKIERVDFIKIDVEGFEKYVIEGGIHTIREFKPTIVLELNHWCLNVFQRTSLPDFFDYLVSIFPFIYAVDSNEFREMKTDDDRYYIMHNHILHNRFQNLIVSFNEIKFQ